MAEQLTIQLSPLQLEGYFIREFSFVLRPGLDNVQTAMQQGLHIQPSELFNPDDITFYIQAGGSPHLQDPSRTMAVLEIRTDNPPERRVPYDFRIVMVGFFKILQTDQSVDQKNLERVVKINSASILYSAAREFIAGVTGRGPLPAIILPAIVLGLDTVSNQKGTATKKKAQAGGKRSAKKTAKKGSSKKKSG